MQPSADKATQSLTRGDLLSALSLAIDLGLGLPMDSMQRTALVAQRLALAAGLGQSEADAAYYLSLLRFVGCTASSHGDAALFGDELGAASLMTADDAEMLATVRHSIGRGLPPWQRAQMFAKAVSFALSGQLAGQHAMHCEAAALIAARLDLPEAVREGVAHTYERWDGRGSPSGVSGEAIRPAMRAVHVATYAALLLPQASATEIASAVRARSGRHFDPALSRIFADDAGALLAGLGNNDLSALVLEAEPMAPAYSGASIDTALEAIADFGDLKTPHMLGHSRRVARLAGDAAQRASMPTGDVALVRHAGLIHDVGRVGVQESLWIKSGPLSAAEQERIRLHSYLTERVFANSPQLAAAGRIGGGHHERLDGTGYHRGTEAGRQPAAMRILAAANAWCAFTEPRPHRPMMTPREASDALNGEAKAGRLDRKAVDAVLSAAGADPRRRRAAGISLSEREIEVLRAVAGQQSNKEIARDLGISPKTVERHVTHIYDKIGVTTRAGAALYAVEHGLA